jgi:hypothetical protein
MIAKAEMRTFLQKQQQAPTQAATQWLPLIIPDDIQIQYW